jgi:SPP1 gp7 family putative phage head morphogenesis protein
VTGPRPDLPDEGRIIRRAILLKRYENALAMSSGRILAQTFADLEALIRRQPPDGVSPQRQAARLQSLTRQANDILAQGYDDLRRTSSTQLRELSSVAGESAVVEVEKRLAARGIDFSPLKLPSRALFTAIVTSDPIQGATLSEWWGQFEVQSRNRFRREIQMGMTRRETVDQISRRLRGMVLRRIGGVSFKGGIYQTAANEVETLVRTAVHEVANAATVLSYQRNSDVVAGVEWLATLDERTCPRCGPLDGQTWKLDDPALRRPPEHPRCRCTTIPRLIGVKHADRVTYDEWLDDQPASVQDRILGKTRGSIYRKGKLALDALIRSDGEFVTLDQLQAKYPAAV